MMRIYKKIKGVIAASLVILMILSNTTAAFGAVVAPKIFDEDGEEITEGIKPGDEVYIEYMLEPEPVSEIQWNNASDVDVILVLDKSSSMTINNNIGKAKDAMVSFVNKLASNSQIKSSIAVVAYGNYGEIVSDFIDLKTNKTDLISKINSIKAYGYTNTGDGLKIANELAESRGGNTEKIIVLLSDGLSQALTVNASDYTKFFEGKGVYGKTSNAAYLYSGDGTLFYNLDGNGMVYDNAIDKDSTRGYAYYMAKKASDGFIDKAFVIGVGDEYNSQQKVENSWICSIANGFGTTNGATRPNSGGWGYKLYLNGMNFNEKEKVNGWTTFNVNANIQNNIKDLYYPVKDFSRLTDTYATIADKILESVKTKNTEFTVPFKTSILPEKTTVGKIPVDAVLVDEVEFMEMSPDKTKEIKEMKSSFTIENNILKCELSDNIVYNYDEKTKKYIANPIRVRIHLEVPGEFNGASIETKEGGGLTYNVLNQDKKIELEAKSFNTYVNAINLVEAKLVIDEFAGTYNLTLKPLKDKITMSIVAKKDDTTLLNDAWKYSNTKLKQEYGPLDISSASSTLKANKCFYIWIKDGSNNYYERVEVLTNEGVEYEDNKLVFLTEEEMKKEENNKKEATLKIGAGEAFDISLDEAILLQYKADGKSSDTTVNKENGVYKINDIKLYDMEYLKVENAKDSTKYHESGKNEVKVSVENASENTTELIAAVECYTRGPLFENVRIEGDYLLADLTKESKDLADKAGTIIVTSSKDTSYYSVVVITPEANNNRSIKVKLTGVDGVKIDPIGKKFEIKAIDIHNNGGITKYENKAAEIESGLINPSTRQFLPATAKIVPNFRYSYGVKINYNGTDDITLEAFGSNNAIGENYKYDGNNTKVGFKGTGYTVYDKSGKKITSGKIDPKSNVDKLGISFDSTEMKEGTEYIIVVDCIFSTNGFKYIGVNTSYSGGSQAKAYEKGASQRLE